MAVGAIAGALGAKTLTRTPASMGRKRIATATLDQRIKALEYDYDILVHSLDVLVENGAEIEVEA